MWCIYLGISFPFVLSLLSVPTSLGLSHFFCLSTECRIHSVTHITSQPGKLIIHVRWHAIARKVHINLVVAAVVVVVVCRQLPAELAVVRWLGVLQLRKLAAREYSAGT